MSDLHPTPRLYDIDLADPGVTRVVRRRVGTRTVDLIGRTGEIATSLSVVVPVGGVAGRPAVEAMVGWNPTGVRVEVLVVEHRDDPGRTVLRDHLARSGRAWRVIERPLGGRVAALTAAATGSTQEFVVIASGGQPPFHLISAALSHMWADGCDAAMLGYSPSARGEVEEPVADPSAELASWIGLRGASSPDRLVILRRWVARWLFNELPRAIDPGEELSDRARLLGIGIVQMDAATPDIADSVRS